jgi:HAMP domain-containing protein
MSSASWVCIGRYTFRVKFVLWLLVLAAIGVFGYAIWSWRRRWQERERASQERFAAFMAEARPKKAGPKTAEEAPSTLPLQKLLFEAAAKAAEAGEPALSIQLYARLLARFPETAFAEQARSAVEAEKQKLAKPKTPGTAGPG